VTTGVIRGAGGVELFRRSWIPRQPPSATLVLVHGLGEHSGRYDHVGRFLAERGVAVHAYDQRGHGRSGGRRGWVERFTDFLDDLEIMLRAVAEESGNADLFLLGHSMGGLIVTAYLVERRSRPRFVVLSGPAIVPLIDAADRCIDPTRLSKDPIVWQRYLTDPLVLRERVTDELLARLADGLALLPGRAGELDMPILLIHGEADALCSAAGACMYLESSASPDLTIRLYPDGRHEMFNETERERVLADLWQWMSEHLASRSR
jgi:acylglycerol lipase